jgi:hypothetical protein
MGKRRLKDDHKDAGYTSVWWRLWRSRLSYQSSANGWQHTYPTGYAERRSKYLCFLNR